MNFIKNIINLLGDAILFVTGWLVFIVADALWALPLPINEDKILWLWAVPATLGFLIEHVGQIVVLVLAAKGIGLPAKKGRTAPFQVPLGTNIMVWVLWDLIMFVPLPIKIAMILIGGGIAIWRCRGPLGTLLGRVRGGIRALINRVRRRPPTTP